MGGRVAHEMSSRARAAFDGWARVHRGRALHPAVVDLWSEFTDELVVKLACCHAVVRIPLTPTN